MTPNFLFCLLREKKIMILMMSILIKFTFGNRTKMSSEHRKNHEFMCDTPRDLWRHNLHKTLKVGGHVVLFSIPECRSPPYYSDPTPPLIIAYVCRYLCKCIIIDLQSKTAEIKAIERIKFRRSVRVYIHYGGGFSICKPTTLFSFINCKYAVLIKTKYIISKYWNRPTSFISCCCVHDRERGTIYI